MADQPRKPATNPAEAWAQIDSTVSLNTGKRVFYNHNGRKVPAVVTGYTGKRNAAGQIETWLSVMPAGEPAFPKLSYLSSSREPGSFDLAKSLDCADDAAFAGAGMPAEPTDGAPVEDTQPVESNAVTPVVTKDPRDTDGDGVVSPKEQKRWDKQHGKE